ncbi:protein transport protein sec24-like [Quercus suber]|uniref:Protein transport protein sec24-like n=1 Tax=Quercus suber TaxID=58331 RepID=A0AAW0IX41_QUESU
MGTENPGRPNFPARPAATPFAAAPPQNVMPFSSPGPLVGSEASGFRPTPPAAPQPTVPFSSSGPLAGSQSSGFRLPPPPRYNDPSVPPPASNVPPTGGPFQRFPTPPFPSTVQAPASRVLPVGQPIAQPPAPPVSFRPQLQIPPVPMGAPPQSVNSAPPNVNVPYSVSDSSFPAPMTNFQSSFPGYARMQSNADLQPPPMQSPFPSHQGGYAPAPPTSSTAFLSHQGGYVPPPPVAAPLGLQSRDQMQYPGSGPPGSIQGLIEDFSSLSIGSVPGSIDPGVDPKALPRPLEGDVEPKLFSEMYPMNCNPRFLRLTTSGIPNSQSLASRWHLPLGAVVCPLAEAPDGEEVPVVNFVSTGIIRCRRCRTYVNPYVTFTDAGRKWRCNICSLLNDVPGDYFAHLDATGKRIDLDQRPELMKGSVEFVAPTEYMMRPPMPPVYFFLIDVSVSAVRSGMIEVRTFTYMEDFAATHLVLYNGIVFSHMKHSLYTAIEISSLTQPQMMVVSDLDDIFVPLPDDLLVNLSESRSVVETFLDSLPSMFQDNVNVESAFGPALKAAFMVMNTLPSLGVGRLKLRGDDLRVYGTDKEHMLRIPEDQFYKQMAAELTKYQIAVNVYAFSDKYTDIASLGVRFTSYHGNFMLRSTDLMALPAVDCDKAYAMQLTLEETLLTTQTVYFQVALLYTASCGERRIRVHTAAAPVVADLGEMYRQADVGAVVSVFSRLAIEKTLSSKLEDARNSVQLRIVKALKEYRNLYAVQHRLGGRIIFPESLKFLPLYGLALCRSTPLRGGYADAPLDERCSAGYTMMTLPVKKLLKLLYPSLIRLDEYLLNASARVDDLNNLEKRLPLAAENLDSRGLYLYDDGFRFNIWFGRALSPDVAMNLLGADFAAELSKVTLSERENEMSRKLMRILKKFRESDPSYYNLCHLVRQGEQPREGFLLLSNLVEDQMGGANGYVDWILQIHRQVQQNP